MYLKNYSLSQKTDSIQLMEHAYRLQHEKLYQYLNLRIKN